MARMLRMTSMFATTTFVALAACQTEDGRTLTLGSPQPSQNDVGYTPAEGATTGRCSVDADCDDHFFCNGVERCAPGDPNANNHGCIRPVPTPCQASQRCDEASQRCLSVCAHAPDADGDGHTSADCGGDDCDDADPNRFPGNPETCGGDPAHDEDCNGDTVGNTDDDVDGYVAARCCNTDRNGVAHCGLDCDDTNAGVHPGLPETCNGIDDNCNAKIDENVKVTLWVDADHDGYGAPGPGTSECPGTDGFSVFHNDCDDTNAAITPGSVKCTDTANVADAFLCDANTGLFTSTVCPLKGTVCIPQPNGTGICR